MRKFLYRAWNVIGCIVCVMLGVYSWHIIEAYSVWHVAGIFVAGVLVHSLVATWLAERP